MPFHYGFSGKKAPSSLNAIDNPWKRDVARGAEIKACSKLQRFYVRF
jgi:hypothetical protein